MALKLSFNDQELPLANHVFYKFVENNKHLEIHLFYDGILRSYRYEKNQFTVITEITQITGQLIYVNDIFRDGTIIFVFKSERSLDFYQYKNHSYIALAKDDLSIFDNTFCEWQKCENLMILGNFYDDENLTGIMTKQKMNGIRFYAIDNTELQKGKNPILELENFNENIFGENPSEMDFFISKIQPNGTQKIISRNQSGLSVYQFDSEKLENIMNIPHCGHLENSEKEWSKFIFGDITGQIFNDLLLFNTSGLFVHQYSNDQNNYRFLHYSPLFSKQKGWESKHFNTIKFMNVYLDDRKEILATGPKGLEIFSFELFSNRFNTILDTSLLPVFHRYADLTQIVPLALPSTEYPIMVVKSQRKNTKWAFLIQNDLDNDDENDENEKSESDFENPIFPQVKEFVNHEKSILSLADQFSDFSNIFKSVDKLTGKVKFTVPLINIVGTLISGKIEISYDGSSEVSGMLGVGWSIKENNFIMLDHKSSIFPEDHTYYFVTGGTPHKIVKMYENTRENFEEYIFDRKKHEKVQDNKNKQQPHSKLRYYFKEEKWEFEINENIQTFGRSKNVKNEPINYNIAWDNWLGSGSTKNGQKEFATVWYLSEIADKIGNSVQYKYDVINIEVPGGKKFTREIYLKNIYDSSGNIVNFNYMNKTDNEYHIPPLQDKNNYYSLTQVNTRYLSGYSVETIHYKQNISFEYNIKDDKRLLVGIIQNDYKNKIWRFKYHQNKFLEQVHLPTGAIVKFNYKSIAKIDKPFEKRYTVTDNYKVYGGNNYNLVLYANKENNIILKMYTDDMTKEILPMLDNHIPTKWPFLTGGKSFQMYEVLQFENSFGIFILFSEYSKVYIFDRRDNEWTGNTTVYTFSKNTALKSGEDFIITADNQSSVHIIEFDKTSFKWIKKDIPKKINTSHKGYVSIAAFSRTFAIYDDENIWIGHRNIQRQWIMKSVKTIPGLIANIKNTIDKFNLHEDVEQQFFNSIKNDMIQTQMNLFVLSGITFKDTLLKTEVLLFLLGKNYEVATEKKVVLTHLDVASYNRTIDVPDPNDKNNKWTLGYVQKNRGFELVVKNLEGPVIDKIEAEKKKQLAIIDGYELPKEKKEEAIKTVNDEYEKYKSDIKKNLLKNVEGRHILFNIFEFIAVFRSLQIVTCKNQKFEFDGNDWKIETLEKNKIDDKISFIPLGDEFIISQKESNSTYKLYKQKSDGTADMEEGSIMDLENANLKEIQIRYPVYIAYKSKENYVNVVEFLSNHNLSEPRKLFEYENLSPWANHRMLITKKFDFLVFRPQVGIKRYLPNKVVKEMIISLDESNYRVSGYDYNTESAKLFGDVILHSNTTFIPGNNSSIFGRIEEDVKFGTRVFDSNGILVQHEQTKNQTNAEHYDDNDDINHEFILFDKSNKYEVARIVPYKIKDDEVDYYGFEDYEKNKRWVFDEKNVIKNGFSLTGKNFLRLKNETLETSFELRQAETKIYLASCWLRNEKLKVEVGNLTPYLKISVYQDDAEEPIIILGQIKLASDNWYYVEAIVDIKEVESTSANKFEKNMKLGVHIAPEIDQQIDIDHIRFSPFSSKFQASVYDFDIKKITSVVQENGLIKKFVYNNYAEEIGTIDEFGLIRDIHIFSKYFGDLKRMKTEIHIGTEGGFYENFDLFSFKSRCKIDVANSWLISPGQLEHIPQHENNLQLKLSDFNLKSLGLRLHYKLGKNESFVSFKNGLQINNQFVEYMGISKNIPDEGEMVLILENDRLFLWINGNSYFDVGNAKSIVNDLGFVEMAIKGNVHLLNLIIFNNPTIQVLYMNSLGEKIQRIKLETSKTAIITEYLYDEIGRQSIQTKPARVFRHDDESLLLFYDDFVKNKNPHMKNSVWEIGKLEGMSSKLIGQYGFTQTKYENNPLNQKNTVGLPGELFSVSGSFAKHYASSSDDLFINSRYPKSEGFLHEVEINPGGNKEISVFDKLDNKVAVYVKVSHGKSFLSTYEYNSKNKLTKLLPPIYHEKVKTIFKTNAEIANLSPEEKNLQELLGMHITYDEKGNMISKTTPDSGKTEFIYDENDLMRFIVHSSNVKNSTADSIVYFNYDQFGRIIDTGKFKQIPKEKNLLNLPENENNEEEHMQFFYSDLDLEPILRNKIKRSIVYNYGEPFVEESIVNDNEDVLNKRIIVPMTGNNTNVIELKKKYLFGKIYQIEYPGEVKGKPFKITYKYNKLGKITAIGNPEKEDFYGIFDYTPLEQISSETYFPEFAYNFTRHYNYNEPGFLTEIKDKFLTEHIYYTEQGYGSNGYNDGTITQTEFEATWHKYADQNKLFLNITTFPDDIRNCFHYLRNLNYLDELNRQSKIFYPDIVIDMPSICTVGLLAKQIANILGEKGFPVLYGHRYDYGNLKELIKAKYFVGNEKLLPLQPNTFSERIKGIDNKMSLEIWNILRDLQYLIENKDKSTELSYGKQGKSFVRASLVDDLKKLDKSFRFYYKHLGKVLCLNFSRKIDLDLNRFKKLHRIWFNNKNIDENDRKAERIWNMIIEKGYLSNPLEDDFYKSLKKYDLFISSIVGVLFEYFGKQLGEAEADVEFYDIDANGNQKQYYTGFDRYQLNYHKFTNKIESIDYTSHGSNKSNSNYKIEHDGRGNVIQAMHKNILKIEYSVTSNKPISVLMQDHTKVEFSYNAQGERVFKKVLNNQGKTVKEVHYIRDETGRSMLEREIIYSSQYQEPEIIITMYIYGPKGLFGFVRNDEFYSVILDHEGSVRLVVKSGEVVAAYDYLPYGELIRKYESYPEARISYRYTGQELDDEHNLYNFHARFYDPSIGRFYQIDPKEQYFSPYKYAGNSPISTIDPDGEFAVSLIIAIVLAIAGAYLGGAAANNNWNPLKWDWGSISTWSGIIFGGISGAFLPSSILAVSGVLTGIGSVAGGLGLAYLGAAGANDSWDPTKWNFSSPETYYGLFSGFASGFGTISALGKSWQIFKSSKIVGKILIAGGIIEYAGLNVVFELDNLIDLTSPRFWNSLTNTFLGSLKKPNLVVNTFDKFKQAKSFISDIKSFKRLMKLLTGGFKTKGDIFRLLARSAIFGGSFTLEGFANNWNFKSTATYYNLINAAVNNGPTFSKGKSGALVSYKNRGQSNYNKIRGKIFQAIVHDADASSRSPMMNLAIGNFKITFTRSSKYFMAGLTYKDQTTIGIRLSAKGFTGPIFKSKLFNEFINIGIKKQVPKNVNTNKHLVHAIEHVSKTIKKDNALHFKDIGTRNVQKVLTNVRIGELTKNKIVDDFAGQFKEKGFVTKKQIGTILKKELMFVVDKTPTVKKLLINLNEIENRLSKLGLDVLGKTSLEKLRLNVQTNLNHARKQASNALLQNINVLQNSIWPYVQNYGNSLRVWSPASQISSFSIKHFMGTDIRYSPSIKIEKLSDLTPMTKFGSSTRLQIKPFAINFTPNPIWLNRINNILNNVKYNSFIGLRQNNVKSPLKMLEYTKTDSLEKRQKRSLNSNSNDNTNFKITSTNTTLLPHCVVDWIKNLFGNTKINEIGSFADYYDKESNVLNLNTDIDLNSTIMLLDLFIRKITGVNFIQKLNGTVNYLEIQGQVLNIVEEFEILLKDICQKCNIGSSQITLDQISLMSTLTKHLVNGSYSKVPTILDTAAKKAMVDLEKRDDFLACLNESLKEILVKHNYIRDNEYARQNNNRAEFNIFNAGSKQDKNISVVDDQLLINHL